MGRYKVFKGTEWVDICDCQVNIRNANNDWQLLDPRNCPTRYWTGTEWCDITCGCVCASGYILNPSTGECEQKATIPATITGGVTYPIIGGYRTIYYSRYGAALYPNITNMTLPVQGVQVGGGSYTLYQSPYPGSILTKTLSVAGNQIFDPSNTITKGRLNISSIWGNGYGVGIWLTVRFCVNISTTKTYIFAIAADNQVKANITSTTFRGGVTNFNLVNLWAGYSPNVTNSSVSGPFDYWHMFPIDLPAGDHVFELSGYNIVDQYAFGGEIYDISVNDLQTLMASTTATPADFDPYVIFSTKDLVQTPPLVLPGPNQPGLTYSCPTGYTFTDCEGAPKCTIDNHYPCEGVLKCSSGSLTGSGGAGIYKVPLLVAANVCDVQITFSVRSVPDSLAIMDFNETIYYAQTGYFGSVNFIPPTGSYTFGPTLSQKIYTYSPGSYGNFIVDTTAPDQTLEIIAQQFPVTNTDPDKIPLAWDPAIPNQTARTITWNKGVTASDVLVMIRIVGHPTEDTAWDIQTLTCVNC
jgi:hypothetical protein